MPVTRSLPQLPNQATPVINADGTMNRVWYSYFNELRAVLELMRVAIP